MSEALLQQHTSTALNRERLLHSTALLDDISIDTLVARLMLRHAECVRTRWTSFTPHTLFRKLRDGGRPSRAALDATILEAYVLPAVQQVVGATAPMRRVLPMVHFLERASHWIAELVVAERTVGGEVIVSFEHFDSLTLADNAEVAAVFRCFSAARDAVWRRWPEASCTRVRWPHNLQSDGAATECGVWVLWYIERRLARQPTVGVTLDLVARAITDEEKLALRRAVLGPLLLPLDATGSGVHPSPPMRRARARPHPAQDHPVVTIDLR